MRDWHKKCRRDEESTHAEVRDMQVALDRKIRQALVRGQECSDERNWLRFYLDFCSKYGHPPDSKPARSPRSRTFQEEYREFLRKHAIGYHERFVWD